MLCMEGGLFGGGLIYGPWGILPGQVIGGSVGLLLVWIVLRTKDRLRD